MNPNKALWEKGRLHAHRGDACERAARRSSPRLGITQGLKVLDLGCGDGTTALPAARLGADVLGVDIARNLVEAGNERAQAEGLTNCRFQEGDASNLSELADQTLRPRRQHLRRDVRAQAVRRRQGDGARDAARRPHRDGELDPERSDAGRADPEDQLRVLAAAAGGLRQPDDVGRREQRDRALRRRGDSEGEDLVRPATPTRSDSPGAPAAFVADFRNYYGPTMNAFEAAEKNGKAADLQKELEALFERQNKSRPQAPRRFPRPSCASPRRCEDASVGKRVLQGLRANAGRDHASRSITLGQPVAAHDLEQAGVIGEAERLGGPRDVPVVLLERLEDDLPLGLRLERLERSGRRRRIGVVAVLAANLRPARRPAPITSSSDAMIIRSRQLRSSRTLFLRQSYAASSVDAPRARSPSAASRSCAAIARADDRRAPACPTAARAAAARAARAR